jgi:TPR repeat protein
MFMRAFGIFFLLLTLVSGSIADEADDAKWNTLYNKEKAGVRYYKKGSYKKAYEKLLYPAQLGLKDAQYYLGFMYLKGQHVDQSLATGMAWLGVACEIEARQWQQTFDQIYNALNVEQRKVIDQKVTSYIQLYGMETQEMDCARVARTGSRKVTVNCRKAFNARMPPEE